MKVRSQSAGVRGCKISAACFQGLGHTILRFGLLGYNYKSGVFFFNTLRELRKIYRFYGSG